MTTDERFEMWWSRGSGALHRLKTLGKESAKEIWMAGHMNGFGTGYDQGRVQGRVQGEKEGYRMGKEDAIKIK